MRKIKILHLEDLPSDVELVERVLKKSDLTYEKAVVDNRVDFERALKDFVPDVILSDHSLPSFNSVEALKIVRDAGITVPFILITATISEDFAVGVIKSGADDYILKDRLQRLPDSIAKGLERRQLESEREEFLMAVIGSEAMMKDTERLSHVGSYHADLTTGAIRWSDELFRLFGYEKGEIEPSFENVLIKVHPDDFQIVRKSMDEAIAGLEQLALEYRVLEKDGAVKYISSELIVGRNSSGKAISVTGYNQDITDMKLAQDEIKALNESLERKVAERTAQLEELNKELESFSYTVSHDLRSPVQVINGYASILNKKYGEQLNEDGRELLDGIKNYTRQMGQIIEDLLRLSRVGRAELNRKREEMTHLVKVVIKELLSGAGNDRVSVKLGNLPAANFDYGLLHQVWVNLISNAIKYSGKVEKPEIVLGAEQKNGQTVYYVKDNGVGFDMQHAEKLFAVFQRLHKASDFEGTGVGLALVQSIIKKHGGTIWAEAKPGAGATFYFTLPD